MTFSILPSNSSEQGLIPFPWRMRTGSASITTPVQSCGWQSAEASFPLSQARGKYRGHCPTANRLRGFVHALSTSVDLTFQTEGPAHVTRQLVTLFFCFFVILRMGFPLPFVAGYRLCNCTRLLRFWAIPVEGGGHSSPKAGKLSFLVCPV